MQYVHFWSDIAPSVNHMHCGLNAVKFSEWEAIVGNYRRDH